MKKRFIDEIGQHFVGFLSFATAPTDQAAPARGQKKARRFRRSDRLREERI